MTLLAVEDLRIDLDCGRKQARGGRQGQLRDRPRRDLRPGRRIRLRQVDHGARHHGAVAATAGNRRRHDQFRWPRHRESGRRRGAPPARQADRDDLSGTDDGAQSAAPRGTADRRDVYPARRRKLARSATPGHRGAGAGARSGARAACARLSVPALRRHAPARDDRYCARLLARSADCGRTHDRARRHGAVRNRRPDARTLRRERHRNPDDQPRSRARREHVPLGRRDVRRKARRDAVVCRRFQDARAPLHARTRRRLCRGLARAPPLDGTGCRKSPAWCRRSRISRRVAASIRAAIV